MNFVLSIIAKLILLAFTQHMHTPSLPFPERNAEAQIIKAGVDVSSRLEDKLLKHEKRGLQGSSSTDWDASFWDSQFCNHNAPSLSSGRMSSRPGPQRANSEAVFPLQCKSMSHCLPLARSTLLTLKANSNFLKAKH